ncbi:hypothetical protein [Actinoplanes sp. NPDC049265]|uniref:hypothetical protein n=1 Tax=Actinoplanes sp. NPDC049265 TaxID=3363902 RepID=UPI0037132D27
MSNWGNYNLPALWNMIQHENSCTGADRVLDWQNLAQSVRDQHRRLLKSREELAAAWPPGTNESATVFFQYLDKLASSMDDTLIRAETTRVGLHGVIEAIAKAQTTIRPLLEQRAAVADDIVPRFVDHAEDEYDEKAQQAMAEAEKTIGEHLHQIQTPQIFTMGGSVDDERDWNPDTDEGSDNGSGSGSGSGMGSSGAALQAHPIPVTVPNDPPYIEGRPGDVPSSVGTVTPPGTLPPSNSGVDLAGVITPGSTGLPPNTIGAPGLATPATLGGGSTGMPLGSGALGMMPGLGAGAGMPLMGPTGRAGAGVGRGPVPMRQGMPSGAVIGGQPGGRGTPGQLMPGQNGRSASGDSEEELLPGGEADQLWGVDKGVAPIITPDNSVARHDPGPGVIGRRP